MHITHVHVFIQSISMTTLSIPYTKNLLKIIHWQFSGDSITILSWVPLNKPTKLIKMGLRCTLMKPKNRTFVEEARPQTPLDIGVSTKHHLTSLPQPWFTLLIPSTPHCLVMPHKTWIATGFWLSAVSQCSYYGYTVMCGLSLKPKSWAESLLFISIVCEWHLPKVTSATVHTVSRVLQSLSVTVCSWDSLQ